MSFTWLNTIVETVFWQLHPMAFYLFGRVRTGDRQTFW